MSEEQYVYVVRQGKEIVALFPNEQRAIYYCQEQLANLHYQKELWRRCDIMIDYEEELLKLFEGELQIENIRRIATYEYEIDTKGYHYMRSGYSLPLYIFRMMMNAGLNNIQIMKCSEGKLVGLFELEYLLTIRFAINKEKFEQWLKNMS